MVTLHTQNKNILIVILFASKNRIEMYKNLLTE